MHVGHMASHVSSCVALLNPINKGFQFSLWESSISVHGGSRKEKEDEGKREREDRKRKEKERRKEKKKGEEERKKKEEKEGVLRSEQTRTAKNPELRYKR